MKKRVRYNLFDIKTGVRGSHVGSQGKRGDVNDRVADIRGWEGRLSEEVSRSLFLRDDGNIRRYRRESVGIVERRERGFEEG